MTPRNSFSRWWRNFESKAFARTKLAILPYEAARAAWFASRKNALIRIAAQIEKRRKK